MKSSRAFIDTNLANFGTDLEYNVKYTASLCEEAWKCAGNDAPFSSEYPNLKVWRIEKFHVKDWPVDKYGSFHKGDCYIVLKRVGHPGKFTYNVHFWMGESSTIDERGTVAYKTVELDTFLHGLPVEYKEEQKLESALFKSYFDKVVYLEGGVETGFHHVEV